MSPLADDDRGERAERRRVAVPDRVTAGAGVLGDLEPEPVPARQRRGDRRRRARACLPAQLGAQGSGRRGLIHPRQADGHAKNPGYCPLDMRASAPGARSGPAARHVRTPDLPADGRGCVFPNDLYRRRAWRRPCRDGLPRLIVHYGRRRHQHHPARIAARPAATGGNRPPASCDEGVIPTEGTSVPRAVDQRATPAAPRRPGRDNAGPAVHRRDVRRPARPARRGSRLAEPRARALVARWAGRGLRGNRAVRARAGRGPG